MLQKTLQERLAALRALGPEFTDVPAEYLGRGRGPATAPGEVLLLSLDEFERQGMRVSAGGVWKVAPEPGPSGRKVGLFGPRAELARRHAITLAETLVPVLFPYELGPAHFLRPERLVTEVNSEFSLADGESCGLPLFLAVASWLMQRPVAASVAATGVLDGDGYVLPVGGLEKKLTVLHEHALRVTHLLVSNRPKAEDGPKTQAENARQILDSLGSNITVVGVDNVRDLLPGTSEEVGEGRKKILAAIGWLVEGLPPPDRRRHTRNLLFDLCRHGLERTRQGRALNWHGVARAARALQQAHPQQRDLALEFSEAVALRHAEVPSFTQAASAKPFLAPQARAMVEAYGLEMLAHLIQDALDAGSDALSTLLASGKKKIDRARKSGVIEPPHLILAGALGRGYGISLQLEKARDVLKFAVDGWMELNSIGDAARPLCAWWWVYGIQNANVLKKSKSERLTLDKRDLENASAKLDSLEVISQAFLLIARGRADVVCGDIEVGIKRLAAVDTLNLPASMRYQKELAQRWKLRGMLLSGHDLDERTSSNPLSCNVVRLFHALDTSLIKNGDSASVLREIEEVGPQAFGSLKRATSSAEVIALSYPY